MHSVDIALDTSRVSFDHYTIKPKPPTVGSKHCADENPAERVICGDPLIARRAKAAPSEVFHLYS